MGVLRAPFKGPGKRHYKGSVNLPKVLSHAPSPSKQVEFAMFCPGYKVTLVQEDCVIGA